jgi:stage V sporulation protein SpoVS
LLAIGADSVTHAVKAISIGRKYLEADGLDISFRPEFTRVKFDDGRDCSAIKLVVLAQQI